MNNYNYGAERLKIDVRKEKAPFPVDNQIYSRRKVIKNYVFLPDYRLIG